MSNEAGKPVSESSIEVTHLVLPPDTNALGTIFGGRIMEWADLAASIVAMRHTRQACVTASMDALHFIAPIHLGDIVVLKAAINYTHTTSLEIGVRVESENPKTGIRSHAASAYLTFVAIDAQGKPIPVPAIIAESETEKRRLLEAQMRRQDRLTHRQGIQAARQQP